MGRPITHTIDPDGEVLIVLRNANAPFAELHDDQDAISEMLAQEAIAEEEDHVHSRTESAEQGLEGFGSSCSAKKLKRNKKKLKKSKKHSRSFSPVETSPRPEDEPGPKHEPEPVPEPIDEPELEYESEPVPVPVDDPEPEPVGEPVSEPESEPEYEAVDEFTREIDQYQSEDVVFIQVSAKHLMLASPVFKAMLTGSWKERIPFSQLQKGSIEITAESWDVDAFLILLRIIHCQFTHIPRKLDLEMLAKVAVIADYYECKEAVQFFSDIWIEALGGVNLKEYSRDLILWLWIAWTFQLSSQFKTVSSIAMSHNSGFISNLGLPIPGRVIGKLPIARYFDLSLPF